MRLSGQHGDEYAEGLKGPGNKERITMKKIQEWADKLSVLISSLMIAAMMFILVFNIIMRFVPGVGGVRWYMESSQYLNVWAMLLVGIQITIRGTHLRVEIIDALVKKSAVGQKVVKVLNDIFILLFYVIAAYASFQLATKAKQAVSTMPNFTMGQVYMMMPVAYGLSALAVIIELIVFFREFGKSEQAKEDK